jgi:hypothetical protein
MPFVGTVEGQFAFGRQPTATQAFVPSNMLLYLDAGNAASYSGSGTTWTDLSPRANNATSLTNATYSSSNGGYLSFDGINGGSGLLDSSKYNTPYTGKTVFVAGNLTSIDVGGFRAMVGAGAGGRNFNLYMYSPSSGVYQLHYSAGGTGSFSTNLSYTAGNWFTAAVTHSTGNVVTYYFNGVQLNQITQTFTQYSASTEYVGRADNFWNGPLSVVTVYKSALSAAEIAANHGAVKGRYGLA